MIDLESANRQLNDNFSPYCLGLGKRLWTGPKSGKMGCFFSYVDNCVPTEEEAREILIQNSEDVFQKLGYTAEIEFVNQVPGDGGSLDPFHEVGFWAWKTKFEGTAEEYRDL